MNGNTEPADKLDVAIVGAGLAGLICARELVRKGRSVRVFEAADAVGGRVRTDEVDGFLLDRGFQILLTAYPEAQQALDFEKLELQKFHAGALVRYEGKFHRFVDPWRKPSALLSVAMAPIGSLRDKLKVAALRRHVCRGELSDLYQRPETTSIQYLREWGFSDRMIERFFRPFLGGVFLDPELETSSRMFEFVFRMFSTGDAVVPKYGMQQIPDQLAATLPNNIVRLNCPVDRIDDTGVVLADQQQIAADNVVVATGATAAHELMPDAPFQRRTQAVSCLYYATDEAPIQEPILVLNGDGDGPINNLCVMSRVSPAYAPEGAELVSVTSLAPDENGARESLEENVRRQLNHWFGPKVAKWRHLRTDWIPDALPRQAPPALSPVIKPTQLADGRFVCGDHRNTASIQGAMQSGRLVAEAIG